MKSSKIDLRFEILAVAENGDGGGYSGDDGWGGENIVM